MAEDSNWDADDFEPVLKSRVPIKTDKWDGEDEEDDIKDSWDKESSETEETEDEKLKAIQKKKKKKLADILAEKEEAKREEISKKLAEKALLSEANKPEVLAAEKLRRLKLEEKDNYNLAKDMLGLSNSGLDGMCPENKDEFSTFEKALTDKIIPLSSSDHYSDFVESLIRNLCLQLSVSNIRKMKIALDAVYSIKLKEDKTSKKKKKGGNIKMDLSKDYYNADGDYEDTIDDFM